eukprot:jgi/Psemu1/288691/fgenesh1_pg.285_\
MLLTKLAAVPVVRAQQRTAQRKCRVIVCGVGGRMGAIRTELVYANPRFELCGVIDTNREAAETVAENYSTQSFGDLESALERFGTSQSSAADDSESNTNTNTNTKSKSTTLDGLLLATPTPSHGPCIELAAAHGLGIFVEKPVAETPAAIRKLYGICEQHEQRGHEQRGRGRHNSVAAVPLCSGFQRRFDPSYRRAANAVRDGAIGAVSGGHVFFGDSPGPSLEFLVEGGNIFSDLCVHDVDFLRWALDDEVSSVVARGTTTSPLLLRHEEPAVRGIQDHATMLLTFRKGTIVALTMSRNASYGYDQRCELFGANGKRISIGNERETTTVLSDDDGDHASRLKHSFDTRFRDAFAYEVDAFCDTLLHETPWPISQKDVIRAQQVAEAARKSLETNQIVYLDE